jgi:hypothetical protein
VSNIDKLRESRARIIAKGPKERSGGAPVHKKQSATPDCIRCEVRATLCDQAGNRWCAACQMRYKLANWGYQHQYEDLKCPPYAIGAGYDLWMTTLLLGNDDFMRSAHAEVKRREREEVA